MTRTNRMPKHMAARKPGYGTKAKAAIVAGTMALAISPSMAFAFPAQPGMGGEQPQMNQTFAGDQQATQGEQQTPQFSQQAPQGDMQAPAGGQGEFGPNQQMPGQQPPAQGEQAPQGGEQGQLPELPADANGQQAPSGELPQLPDNANGQQAPTGDLPELPTDTNGQQAPTDDLPQLPGNANGQQMPGQAGQLPADGAGAPDGTSAQPAGQLPAFGQQGAANGFDGMIRQVIKHVAQAFDMQLDDDELDQIFQSISQQFAVEPGPREAVPFANAALPQPGMQGGTEQAPAAEGDQEAPAWAPNEQRPPMPGNLNQFQLSGGQRPTMPDMGQQVPSGEQTSIA